MAHPLDSVFEYLEKTRKDLSSGLTAKKVMERGNFLMADSGGTKIYFEVERHNSVLGAMYTPGAPMAAFVTRWIKYSFDEEGIKEHGDSRPPLFDVNDIDFHALAECCVDQLSFSIEEDENNKWWISESCCNGPEVLVSSIGEICDYARSIVADQNYGYLVEEISDYVSKETTKNVIDELTSTIVTAAQDKAKSVAEYGGFGA
jgi:hypothetical protein